MKEGGKVGEFEQRNLDFECKKGRDATEVKRFESVAKLEGGVASSTPEKASERIACKSKLEKAFELPERYKSIVELFRKMCCSLRLLRLCNKSTTLRNVCRQVEILAKRKFLYEHLGQIKYILPEAVRIQRIVVHDEESQCMKPDLKITLVFDVVKDHRQNSDFIALSHLFFSRVVDFIRKNSEGCDIPEATLPQPFSQDNECSPSEVIFPDTLVGLNSSVVDTESTNKSSAPTPLKATYSPARSSHGLVSPLVYHSSEAANLMIETPTQLPPRRALLETEELLVATPNKALIPAEKPAKRSLDFTFETANRYVLANTVKKSEHPRHPQAAKSKDDKTDKKVSSNKEKLDGGNSSVVLIPDSNNESTKTTCNMLSSLRECIPVIHQIFRSVNYSPITKQELVFKILINSLDIEERGMVEETIEQLELLLPNWISKRISPAGDLMYSIMKLPDVSALLVELQS